MINEDKAVRALKRLLANALRSSDYLPKRTYVLPVKGAALRDALKILEEEVEEQKHG